MANEVSWWIDGIDSWWEVRSDVNKVTEEAVRRVQDNQKKAKQVWQQIKKDKDINNKFAEFLWFLLKKINNDKMIGLIYNIFFKTKHPKNNLVYLRKNINSVVIVGMFMPFYINEIKKIWLDLFFAEIYDLASEISLTKYISYLKKLSAKYHDNVPIDKEMFVDFLVEIINQYKLVDVDNLWVDKFNEFRLSLVKELYGAKK